VGWLGIFTLLPFAILVWLVITIHIRGLLQRHFYSLANVIESLRMGDFNMRIAPQITESAWSTVYEELNILAQRAQQSRLSDVESDILLNKLLAEFDVPVFVFDRNDMLKNINPMGEKLFADGKASLIGMTAKQLHIEALIQKESGTVMEHWFPNRGGRWELRKNYFLQDGYRYTLILVNDLSRTLREEERNAWMRLIRVLGHELNNSLASLSSLSQSLQKQLHDEKTDQWHERYAKALRLIDDRSNSLLRFTEAYTRLAKLPTPTKKSVSLLTVVCRLKDLLEGNFVLATHTDVTLNADPDQLEQVLINLMKNAVEASSTEQEVHITWEAFSQGVRIQIIDQGLGLPASDNLFVPFYTTKPQGSGIGLFLCRQIIESHNGTLKLRNRNEHSGCIAEIWLPH
jgi:nitrogen fixation/metabolism regulation signal transduction histidine kinase